MTRPTHEELLARARAFLGAGLPMAPEHDVAARAFAIGYAAGWDEGRNAEAEWWLAANRGERPRER